MFREGCHRILFGGPASQAIRRGQPEDDRVLLVRGGELAQLVDVGWVDQGDDAATDALRRLKGHCLVQCSPHAFRAELPHVTDDQAVFAAGGPGLELLFVVSRGGGGDQWGDPAAPVAPWAVASCLSGAWLLSRPGPCAERVQGPVTAGPAKCAGGARCSCAFCPVSAMCRQSRPSVGKYAAGSRSCVGTPLRGTSRTCLRAPPSRPQPGRSKPS